MNTSFMQTNINDTNHSLDKIYKKEEKDFRKSIRDPNVK